MGSRSQHRKNRLSKSTALIVPIALVFSINVLYYHDDTQASFVGNPWTSSLSAHLTRSRIVVGAIETSANIIDNFAQTS